MYSPPSLTTHTHTHTTHRGYLGPGGLSEWGTHYNCTGGAAGFIDHWLFSDNHIYQNPTAKISVWGCSYIHWQYISCLIKPTYYVIRGWLYSTSMLQLFASHLWIWFVIRGWLLVPPTNLFCSSLPAVVPWAYRMVAKFCEGCFFTFFTIQEPFNFWCPHPLASEYCFNPALILSI